MTMKSVLLMSALAAATQAAAGPNTAQLLFSDNFQEASLSPAIWPTQTSPEIVAAPVGSGRALHFTQTHGGYDIVSQPIAGADHGTYKLGVDYYCGTEGGCAGFIGVYPGGSASTVPGSSDGWLATDTKFLFNTPFSLVTGATSFAHNSFVFSTTSTGTFSLKLEDFAGQPGDAYFKNLTLTAVPEAATWGMMVAGFALVGFAARRRTAIAA